MKNFIIIPSLLLIYCCPLFAIRWQALSRVDGGYRECNQALLNLYSAIGSIGGYPIQIPDDGQNAILTRLTGKGLIVYSERGSTTVNGLGCEYNRNEKIADGLVAIMEDLSKQTSANMLASARNVVEGVAVCSDITDKSGAVYAAMRTKSGLKPQTQTSTSSKEKTRAAQ
jgi:phosphosulfolactate synthase (CoM biosynthesis protein A)